MANETDTRIIAGWDGEQQHHRDGAYLAYLSSNFNKEARGSSVDDAVSKLRAKYPETKRFPIIS